MCVSDEESAWAERGCRLLVRKIERFSTLWRVSSLWTRIELVRPVRTRVSGFIERRKCQLLRLLSRGALWPNVFSGSPTEQCLSRLWR